jgi:hypothetical protein
VREYPAPFGYEYFMAVLPTRDQDAYQAGLTAIAEHGRAGWRAVGFTCDPDGVQFVLMERRVPPPRN